MDETWLTSLTFNADDDKSSFGHFCLIFWGKKRSFRGKNGPFFGPKMSQECCETVSTTHVDINNTDTPNDP